ncbi:hypothetical protein BS47DRAFT_1035465 [Hydnum rufescens UP504]|uniref:Uncharacterized protein n=1 Tax=Hydnum rufescens UP504 TaxID=1448309 RepID=A0A9P6DVL0_9AGAM|nr:hypothetical protein BS47DRAFT_1035465 [Hydnum rufescens UP504]
MHHHWLTYHWMTLAIKNLVGCFSYNFMQGHRLIHQCMVFTMQDYVSPDTSQFDVSVPADTSLGGIDKIESKCMSPTIHGCMWG